MGFTCFSFNRAFQHAETLVVQGNQVRTDQKKPLFVCLFVLFCWSLFEVCFDQYKLDCLGRIKFIHVEMPYIITKQNNSFTSVTLKNFWPPALT